MTPELREEIKGLRDKWGEESPRLYEALSDLLFRAGKIPAAMNLLEYSLSGGPDTLPSSTASALSWFDRGVEFADACLYEESYQCLLRAMGLGYENYESFYCLAGIEKSMGLFEEAEIHCRKALDSNPGFAPAHSLFASLAKLAGRFGESVAAQEKALALHPDCAATLYDLACYRALAGQETLALATLETALEMGFNDLEWLRHDPDLSALRGLPGFALLMRVSPSRGP